MREFIKEGAEARLYLDEFNGKKIVVKERIKKDYRNEILDKRIRHERVKAEALGLIKARKLGVRTPIIYKIDRKNESLTLEFLGKRLLKKELTEEKIHGEKALELVGEKIARMHESDLIHGDLTTSNIFLVDENVAFIDFGLSKVSRLVEDKAMDLVVFEKTFMATHPDLEDGWKALLKGYEKISSNSKAVFKRMKEIKERARYL